MTRGTLRTLSLVGCFLAARADEALPERSEVLAAMIEAAEAFHGLSHRGAHVHAYSLDGQTRFDGRHGTRRPFPKDEPDWVETEPPAGGWIGRALLRAYRITDNRAYLTMAEEIADALAGIQTASGGWPARARMSRPPGAAVPSDLDDNRSQSTIRFFVELVDAGADERHRAVMQRGVDFLHDAQYPSGGWPQYHPPAENQGDYRRYHTINDATIPDCMRTLLTAYRVLGRQEHLDSVRRAADWLLRVRLPGAAWAQQYYDDFVKGPLIPNHPAPARWFEPMALTASESASVIAILRDVWLETGDPTYIEPFDEVAQWYERSRLEDGRWARFYELHTNRPLYCTPDRVITYASTNLRPGYAWHGTWGRSVLRTVEEVNTLGLEGMLQARGATPREARLRELGTAARRAMESMDNRGLWSEERFVGAVVDTHDKRIWAGLFRSNLNAMSAYLEALPGPGHDD